MHGKKEADTETEKLITMTSGGFLIVVRYNSFIDSRYHSLEPT